VLWKCNLDCNTNDSTNGIYVENICYEEFMAQYKMKDTGVLDGIVKFIIYAVI
jgi:hypothetical protein